jgi:2-dehydro-3-deoxyphosphogluconate aldolase / (4S)-4-hydroxy-2-oxoglutarate aldolase
VTALDQLRALVAVPVVIADEPACGYPLREALIGGGLPVAEVTLRTPAAPDVIRVLAERGDILVGAGTVLSPAQVDKAVDAGATFIVSPGLSRAVVERCRERDVLPLPGAVTATEVQAALELGVDTLKFFPAEAAGGPRAITALAAPFSGISFISSTPQRRRGRGLVDGPPRPPEGR